MTQYVGTTLYEIHPSNHQTRIHECCNSYVNDALLTNESRPGKTQWWGWCNDTDAKGLPEKRRVVLGLVSGRLLKQRRFACSLCFCEDQTRVDLQLKSLNDTL